MEYGLNDAKRIKKKKVTLKLYSFTPSDMNFQTILYSAANRAAGCLWAALNNKYHKKIPLKANMLKNSMLNVF